MIDRRIAFAYQAAVTPAVSVKLEFTLSDDPATLERYAQILADARVEVLAALEAHRARATASPFTPPSPKK